MITIYYMSKNISKNSTLKSELINYFLELLMDNKSLSLENKILF
jgi:hypothetical protein